MPNVQTLRHDVECEGDEALVGRSGIPRVRKGSREQLTADAITNSSARNQRSPHTQLRAKPRISPSASATHKPSGSSLSENRWKSGGREVAIRPKPWRSVRSLMLRTTSSSARCNSSARAGRYLICMGTGPRIQRCRNIICHEIGGTGRWSGAPGRDARNKRLRRRCRCAKCLDTVVAAALAGQPLHEGSDRGVGREPMPDKDPIAQHAPMPAM